MSSSRASERYELVWSSIAEADVEGILRYTAIHWSIPQARRLHAKLKARSKTLTRFPLRCRVVPELGELGVLDFRELILTPHRVVFRIHGRQVVIVGVLDGRRDLDELLLARSLFGE